MTKDQKTRVLIDMDGTVCDFTSRLWEAYLVVSECPERFNIPNEAMQAVRSTYPSLEGRITLPTDFKHLLFSLPGFWSKMRPFTAHIDLIANMRDAGLLSIGDREPSFIVSTQGPFVANGWSEKYEWVNRSLKVDNLVVSYDKSIVKGDVLIDDNPKVFIKWLREHYPEAFKEPNTCELPRVITFQFEDELFSSCRANTWESDMLRTFTTKEERNNLFDATNGRPTIEVYRHQGLTYRELPVSSLAETFNLSAFPIKQAAGFVTTKTSREVGKVDSDNS